MVKYYIWILSTWPCMCSLVHFSVQRRKEHTCDSVRVVIVSTSMMGDKENPRMLDIEGTWEIDLNQLFHILEK